MKLLRARAVRGGLFFQVRIDESLPAVGHNIGEFYYPADPPNGLTLAQYLAQIRFEIKRACQAKRASQSEDPVTEGVALPDEGVTL